MTVETSRTSTSASEMVRSAARHQPAARPQRAEDGRSRGRRRTLTGVVAVLVVVGALVALNQP